MLLKKIVENGLLPLNEPIEFIASRRETKKMLNTSFITCVRENAKNAHLTMKVSIKPPHEEKGLQVVDVLCRAIYQKYENNNDQYYQIIQPLILDINEK
jgi:two-component SAPR family response regulator